MSSISRRQFLGCSVGVLAGGIAAADCRDERRIPQPHELAVEECLELYVRSDIFNEKSVARATFTFGLYEELLRYNNDRKWFRFEFAGLKHRIKVTRVGVDVNRQIGCVVVEVDGAYVCER